MVVTLDSVDLYKIGWIATLPVDRAAAIAMLDEQHDPPRDFEQDRYDPNSYAWGRIHEHNIVITSGSETGYITVNDFLRAHPNIGMGLLVGIGGGIPRHGPGVEELDIRLGDVAVSHPTYNSGGLLQYDVGMPGPWERRGNFNNPPQVLLHALSSLRVKHLLEPSSIPDFLEEMSKKNPYMVERGNRTSSFVHPGVHKDRLFVSTYTHNSAGDGCSLCESASEIVRHNRASTDPEIHYGIIASGNSLIRDAITRDRLGAQIGQECICFEVDAAGIMNHFPCLVIKGICNYSDSHANDEWKGYASATAAALAKELLDCVLPPPLDPKVIQRASGMFKSSQPSLLESKIHQAANGREVGNSSKQDVQDLKKTLLHEDLRRSLARLPVVAEAAYDSSEESGNPVCLKDTRVELLDNIMQWTENPDSESIFWLSGMAGTGKSTISRSLAMRLHESGSLGASFFFKQGESGRGVLSKVFTTIAAQLATKHAAVAPHIQKAITENSTIGIQSVKEQFDKLILHPLTELSRNKTITAPIIIVIDALDECELGEGFAYQPTLISLLIKTKGFGLRFFVTSRPELSTRLEFDSIKSVQLASWHNEHGPPFSDDEGSLPSTDQQSIFSSRRSTLSVGEMSYTTASDQLAEINTAEDMIVKPQSSSEDTILDSQHHGRDNSTLTEAQHPRPQDDDDIESIFSETGTVFSEASRVNHLESNALHVLAEYLAGLEELAPLFKIALDKMTRDRFSNNLGRILKAFYLQLQHEASNERERMAVGVFRRHRTKLAREITDITQGRDDESQHDMHLDVIDYRQTLNDWLTRLPQGGVISQRNSEPIVRVEDGDDARTMYSENPPIGPGDDDYGDATDSTDDETESNAADEQEIPQLLEIKEVELFLTRGRAFRNLRRDLRMLRLPKHLRVILNTVPKSAITLSTENDNSTMNKMKLFFENYTGYHWDWSPLTSPLPNIQPGNVRVEWKDYGCELQREVSQKMGKLLEEIIPLLDDDRPNDGHHCLAQPTPVSLRFLISQAFGSLKNRLGRLKGSFQRAANEPLDPEQEPISSAAIWARRESIDELDHGTLPQFDSGYGTVAPGNMSRSNTLNYRTDPPSEATTDSLHIVFGVQGWRWSLMLQGISISASPSDSDFFKGLRRFHGTHRFGWFHWFYRCFSVFRFLNCRFVKFEKTFVNGFTSGFSDELPDSCGYSESYFYKPRGLNVKTPLIEPNRFRILLSECNEFCLGNLLLPWHECIRLSPKRSHPGKIPQKKGGFSMLDEAGEEVAFGIEADYMVCFKRLAIYHLLLIIGPVIFWGVWMWKHPGDWQNASVPLLAVIALMTVFWFMFDRRVPIR